MYYLTAMKTFHARYIKFSSFRFSNMAEVRSLAVADIVGYLIIKITKIAGNAAQAVKITNELQ
jgi:hypothetical protein